MELNRAIAVGMHLGPEAGLEIIYRLLDNDKLKSYHIIYSAQAELAKKLGRKHEAINAYQQALELVRQAPEERYLKQKLSEIME